MSTCLMGGLLGKNGNIVQALSQQLEFAFQELAQKDENLRFCDASLPQANVKCSDGYHFVCLFVLCLCLCC